MHEFGSDTESGSFIELIVLLLFIAQYTSTLLLCLASCLPPCHRCDISLRYPSHKPKSEFAYSMRGY